jgi:cobyrinic acid a,c-diamide synthase
LASTLDGTGMVGAVEADAAMADRLTLRYPDAVAVSDSLLTRTGDTVTGHEFHRTATVPVAGESAAWQIDGESVGWATPTLHASYLHTHWAGHPHLAQRFAAAASLKPGLRHVETRVAPPRLPASGQSVDLAHHGDVEATEGLLDFAVNVYPGPRPDFLEQALSDGLASADRYPDPTAARQALAKRHGRTPEEVLPTSGASEAFELIARVRPWKRPVVIHPGFTEPHLALERAGRTVTTVLTDADFRLRPERVPADADLVVIGNPTNPTGVLHPADDLRALTAPGRVVVVDEAFIDAVPGEPQSLAAEPGIVVVRSLTKHWSIPGIRAGYVLAEPGFVAELEALQTPWSVSSPALSAMVALSDVAADSERRAADLTTWRAHLVAGLSARGIRVSGSSAPYVLAQVGSGVHARLREAGIAVRRADTFPGLDDTWVRIAARPADLTDRLLAALDEIR